MSSFALKLVACITMFVDHLGLALFDNNRLMRIIGRIAMPIFAFQVGVGFSKTHSKWKYILRMFICFLISEVPFLMLLSSGGIAISSRYGELSLYYLNICFTFLLALIALYFIELGKKNFVFFICAIFAVLPSFILHMDYGIYAIAIVIASYFLQNYKLAFSACFVVISAIYHFVNNSPMQLFMLLALPFILLYNGKKGKSLKYYFYVFYPLHMLLIALIKIYLLK